MERGENGKKKVASSVCLEMVAFYVMNYAISRQGTAILPTWQDDSSKRIF